MPKATSRVGPYRGRRCRHNSLMLLTLTLVVCGTCLSYFTSLSRRCDYSQHSSHGWTVQPSAALMHQQVMWTPTGDYAMHPHYWAATPQPSSAQICLATFCSVHRLSWLPWLLQAWSGPMSVSVFVPGHHYIALSRIVHFLQHCYHDLHHRVALHLLYPHDMPPVIPTSDEDNIYLNCTHPKHGVQLIIEASKLSVNDIFPKLPQNHLRNLARRTCATPFSLVIDIDMIPSPLMYERLNLHLQDTHICQKCALVIPVYEIDSSQTLLPATKNTLLLMLKENKAQPYHIQVYDKNQGNSHLEVWERANILQEQERFLWSLSSEMPRNASAAERLIPYRVLYTIASYEQFWEPIVVLPRRAPGFDERFIGFGFCRSSQIYELHLRGFTFRMLDQPFLSHWGFQTITHYPQHRMTEIKENSVRYEAFKRELQARYHLPSRSTPSKNQRRPPLIAGLARPHLSNKLGRSYTLWRMKETADTS